MNSKWIQKLKEKIRGEVRFDDGSRALYATDASNYRQVPIGVVIPRDVEDVIETVALCRGEGVPILTRGAGTSLAGQCCNVAVVLDLSKHLQRIVAIDPEKKEARVEPGVVLDMLREAARPYGLTFGPDPATHNRCTLGGMIGNNACGVHSVMAGKTVDNVEELEVLTYEGLRLRVGKTSEADFQKIVKASSRPAEIYSRLKSLAGSHADRIRARFPKIPRRVSGYNLDELLPENGFHVARSLVGTEGTCAVVLEAKVKLLPDPPVRALVILSYADVYEAGDDVPRILSAHPIGLEGLDENFILNMKKARLHWEEIAMLPEGAGWLYVEFGGGSQEEVRDQSARFLGETKSRGRARTAKLFTNAGDQKRMWGLRESSFGATVFVPNTPDTFSGFEDSAVPPAKLGDYMRALQKLYDKYGYYAVTYGHFGDGCLHTRIGFDLKTDPGIQKYRAFLEEASDLVILFGGSLSGEHGDGQNWGALLPKMFGPELVGAFREFKSIWDPQNKMNPGKVVDSFGPEENLRLKTYPAIPQPRLHFSFAEDGGSFARTTERCIGIGKCLKKDEGTMCPSYMVTGEERHSTRGRARLLFEMMRGEVIQDGFRDGHVKEALDLCLACKGCVGECPVHVDMASYKAEFLSHYYQGRPRPLGAYAFGLIPWWARLASFNPGLSNALLKIPSLQRFVKRMIGVADEREFPRFGSETFQAWFRKRDPQKGPGPFWPKKGQAPSGARRVLLWPDTFNNYFYPATAKAAVEVLEALGFQVLVPEPGLCCGRPLYDYGMLGLAKKFLKKILRSLAPALEQGIPIVGLEPSCLAVFRDDLGHLFPNDSRAKKLKESSFLFGEFVSNVIARRPKAGEAISKVVDCFAPSGLAMTAKKLLVHGHCHQKALMGMQAEEALLQKLGLDVKILDSGCCGMAGAFGFEKDHYEISVKIAERVLLPSVRHASDDTLVISDGFSCREQIRQLTGRKALHLAEALKLCLSES